MSPVPPAPSGVAPSRQEPRSLRPEVLPLLGLAAAGAAAWWWQLGLPQPAYLLQVLAEVAPVGILVVAITLLLAGGAIDLAIGGLGMAAALVAAKTPALAGLAPALGALTGLVVAGLLGALDGLAVTLTRRPAWLVTGVMLLGYAGLSSLVLALPQITAAESVRWAILDWRSPEFTLAIPGGSLVLPSLPLAFWCWIVVLVLVPCLLHATAGGNRVLALGASPAVAKGLGISVLRTRMGLFAVAAVLAGLAGLVEPATPGPVQPLVELTGALEALFAAVIGGAVGLRRREAFLGGALALVLLSVVGRQLASLGLPPGVGLVALALLLLLALGLGARRRSIAAEAI